MCIYFFVELVLFLCFLLTYKSKERVDVNVFYFAAFIFLFIQLFRSDIVGNDSHGYAGFFTLVNSEGYGTVDNPDPTMEVGIVYYGKFLRLIFGGSNWYVPYFIFNALLIFFPVVYFIGKYSANKPLSLFLFMTVLHSGLLVIYFSMLRQLLGMSFLMYGCIAYDRKVKYWYVWLMFCWGIALYFHSTILLMELLVIVLFFIKGNKKSYYYLLTLVLVVNLLFKDFTFEVFQKMIQYIELFDRESRMLRYQSNFGETSASSIYILITVLLGYFFVYFSEEQEENSFFLKCFILAIVLYGFMNSIFMVNRMSSIFWTFGLCGAIPMAVRNNKLAFNLMIVIASLLLVQAFNGYNNWTKTDSTLPYYFMWEK